MPLDLPTLLALAQTCAPAVAPQTLLAVARVESGFEPLAIGVNGPHAVHLTPATPGAAATAARALVGAGRDIDLGLGQINIRNLEPLGLDLESVFDPCRNLAASGQVLQAGYALTAPAPGAEQPALRAALSRYNTGSPDRGLGNGYVAKVVHAAAVLVPAIEASRAPAPPVQPPAALRPAWSVFGAPAAGPGFVISPSYGDRP